MPLYMSKSGYNVGKPICSRGKMKNRYRMDRDNTPVTERTMETQNLKQSRPSSPSRQISNHSDWSDSEDGKDDQARAKSLDTQEDPQTQYFFCQWCSSIKMT